MRRLRLLPLLFAAPPVGFASAPAPSLHDGVTMEVRAVDGATWTVATVDVDVVRVDTLGQAPGDPKRFAELPGDVLVATNTGIFESVDEPSGWFVEGGVERHALNHRRGHGNFYLRPNGAFWIDEAGPAIAPTEAVAPLGAVSVATQSGPLLRWHGHDTDAIDPSWTGRGARNFVGLTDEGDVVFAFTHDQVTLAETLAFARDSLALPDALYLDGNISDLCVADGCRRASRTFAGFLVVRP